MMGRPQKQLSSWLLILSAERCPQRVIMEGNKEMYWMLSQIYGVFNYTKDVSHVSSKCANAIQYYHKGRKHTSHSLFPFLGVVRGDSSVRLSYNASCSAIGEIEADAVNFVIRHPDNRVVLPFDEKGTSGFAWRRGKTGVGVVAPDVSGKFCHATRKK
ncbi:hypothetical protein DFS33DRAFT_1277169 [Desarmillaria ectypa]|nr:hypothetical protein DFS33DRAFT_1277169 [Desarmillaria ectypa]